MWIVTTWGFLSVVQNAAAKAPHEALLVRGRVQADLALHKLRGIRP